MIWQPIETAPKDKAETEVLTFTPAKNGRVGILCGVHVGFYSHCFREWRQSDLEWEIDPTHWMPIPPEPVEP